MGVDPARLAELRRGYADYGLAEADLAPHPHAQFDRWLSDAVAAAVTEPNAMVLGTVGADGRPSSRTVLLKQLDDAGFVFFTNYGSRKAVELAGSPVASLLFPWYDLERQVIVAGRVTRVDPDDSAAYFRSRPHGSQIGAWASRQSEVVAGREVLADRFAELSERWPQQVPVPPFWGGFRLVADTVEFWQGRPSRLHDRLRYVRDTEPAAGGGQRSAGVFGAPGGAGWRVERLSP